VNVAIRYTISRNVGVPLTIHLGIPRPRNFLKRSLMRIKHLEDGLKAVMKEG